MTQVNTYRIGGMACAHCQATVTKALSALEGAEQVDVDLTRGTATVQGAVAPEEVEKAVTLAGFELLHG